MGVPGRRIWLLASKEVPHFSCKSMLCEELKERAQARGAEKFDRRYKSGEYKE